MSTITTSDQRSTQLILSKSYAIDLLPCAELTWFCRRRSLSPDQCEQAAAQFGAERAYISASKKLIDAAHPAMRASIKYVVR